ncbi:MAG: EAL domain-containing protein [Pseudomonadota bacterium]
MLLIIGNETGRLPNIAHIASHAQLKLAVAANRSALATALSTSRRNVVLFDEDELDASLVGTLAVHASEPNLRILVLCRKQAPQQYTLQMFAKLNKRVQWLPANTNLDALADRIRDYRNAMLMIQREELVAAVREQQFLIQYQPKVRWVSGEDRWQTSEVEALIRWRHPAYGLIGPRFFLPEAEEFGLMGDITELVLRATLKQLSSWQKTGLDLGGSVNLSPTLLSSDADLAVTFSNIVGEFELPTDRIMFELPASEVMPADRRAAIQNLREAGFKVALEDFGAMDESREVFGAVEFDEIKIHASVLMDEARNETANQSLAALTKMAHNLGIDVCAQGVESEEVFEVLGQIHCDKLQGYLVSEAVMPEIIQHQYATAGGDGEEVTYAYLM